MPDAMDWQDWVRFAEENHLVALENQETRASTTILLAHQAVEKYLKAIWIMQEKLPERSHDLALLLKTIEPNSPENHVKAARELNYFLPRVRYPNQKFKLTEVDVQNAINYTKLLRALARKRLGLEQQ
jgi:HEPN domain-containing protein